jgi:hypothetical protein
MVIPCSKLPQVTSNQNLRRSRHRRMEPGLGMRHKASMCGVGTVLGTASQRKSPMLATRQHSLWRIQP